MRQIFGNLSIGLALAILVIFLLLAANFESIRLSLIVLSTIPAVLTGVLLMLLITGTTLNLESFMGAIMAIGVAVANAILLVTFAEKNRKGRRRCEDCRTKRRGRTTASRVDDQPCHDRRNDPHGARDWTGQRRDSAAWPGGHWGLALRHRGNVACSANRFRPDPETRFSRFAFA